MKYQQLNLIVFLNLHVFAIDKIRLRMGFSNK